VSPFTSARRSAVVPLRGRTLIVFDPEILAHRRDETPKWTRSPSALAAEANEGRLLRIEVGDRPFVNVTVEVQASEPGPLAPGRLQVSSGAVFAGDAADLPSRAWRRRRWNVWDWLLLVFAVAALPVLWWLFGFDRNVLSVAALIITVFVAMLVPISWAIFRGGSGFAKRSGVPPIDHPEQLLDVPAGSWRVQVESSEEGGAVRILLRA
jgi:hypothetical protein